VSDQPKFLRRLIIPVLHGDPGTNSGQFPWIFLVKVTIPEKFPSNKVPGHFPYPEKIPVDIFL